MLFEKENRRLRIFSTLIGGLGNQMFGYAASLYYAKRWGGELQLLSLPESRSSSFGYSRPFQLSHFQIDAPIRVASLAHRLHQTNVRQLKPTMTRCNSWLGVVCLAEPRQFTFHPGLQPPAKTRRVYLRGYWQAHQYVLAMEAQLRNDFRFRTEPFGLNRNLMERIRSADTTISIHVRRGDYLNVGMALPTAYYDRAIAFMSEHFPGAMFVVFSDDMEFAHKQFDGAGLKAIFADGNTAETAYEDLRLMSACTHHIIANSTFSWWGAWLSAAPAKRVVSPRYWDNNPSHTYPDLCPAEWTRLDN